MMHRHDEPRACGICHFHGLLGRAMSMDPWVVSADGHNGDIDFAVSSQFCETIRHCGITSENDAPPPAIAGLEQITVITAISIPPFSRAPVVHSESSNIDLVGSS